jgi:hypothetical protein
VFHVAVFGNHLVWEAAGLESDKASVLRQEDLGTGRILTLAANVLPDYGLVATHGWVFYATQAPSGRVQLAGVRYDGSGHMFLSGYLAAPIDGLGDVVGWAEVDGGEFNVLVRDATRKATWLAASIPRCSKEGCYRVDAVTLAHGGVVFDLGAVGPQPSRVVRRSFGAVHTSTVEVPGDPQPDLVPSSAGALYYRFNHGWYRWNFGEERPHATSYMGATPASLLRFDEGHFFLLITHQGCKSAITAQKPDGRSMVLQRSRRIFRLSQSQKHECAYVTDLTWTGHQAIAAWTIASAKAESSHEDAGLVGVIVAGRRTGALSH